MRVKQDIGIYDVENPIIKETTFPELGNSQIIEPNIITPIYDVSDLPNSNIYTNTGNTSSGAIPIEVITPVDTSNTSTGSTSGTKDTEVTKPKGEPSATTDETKTYVGGGTTPDSQIVVKKPTTKYFVYGIVGIVVAYLGYKVFFNKKSV